MSNTPSTRFAPKRLRIWTKRRNWRRLWLTTFWHECELVLPAGTTLLEASDKADELRAQGAGVRMEWK